MPIRHWRLYADHPLAPLRRSSAGAITAIGDTQINQRLISLVEEHLPMPRWRGLRVVAGDGTAVRLTLLNDEGLRRIVQAVAFGLYLPDSELFVDFALCEPVGDERVRLFERLHLLRPDDLLVLDRGFPCRWLVSALSARQMPFCIRCDIRNGFKAVQRFMRSGLAEQQVRLPAPPKKAALAYGCPRMPTTVRLVRVVAPNAQQYVIMTSLIDPIAYPASAFAALYHGRWRIEEAFKRIKHRLGLEHTSGLSWQAAQQDFGAKAVYDNLAALAAWVATEEHLPDDSPYKINRTQAIDKIKRYLGRWLLLAASGLRGLRAVLNEIAMNVQKFVPNRSRPRPHRPKPHRSHAYKPV